MTGIDNPLLLDFPDSFETERLIIHALRGADRGEYAGRDRAGTHSSSAALLDVIHAVM